MVPMVSTLIGETLSCEMEEGVLGVANGSTA